MPLHRFSVRQMQVLRAVKEGRVWEHYPVGMTEPIYSDLDKGPGASRPRFSKVTDAVRLLQSYSLIKLSMKRAQFKEARQWEITADGIALLEAPPPKRGRPPKKLIL